jgi:DNA invertase Pin-like site-specific DNA recombinase
MLLGYARISDGTSQRHDLQLDALRQAGCDRIYVEAASGARTDRTELAKLLEQARPGDQVCVWRLDRLGRSLRHLIEIADDLQRRDIGLRSLTEAIDTATPGGRFVFSILGALGQMELEIVRARTRAGLAAAAARGRKGGRPPALNADKLKAARAMLAAGTMSAVEVARQVGCSPSTLYRHIPGGRSAVAA